jgi:hypothetical protein
MLNAVPLWMFWHWDGVLGSYINRSDRCAFVWSATPLLAWLEKWTTAKAHTGNDKAT